MYIYYIYIICILYIYYHYIIYNIYGIWYQYDHIPHLCFESQSLPRDLRGQREVGISVAGRLQALERFTHLKFGVHGCHGLLGVQMKNYMKQKGVTKYKGFYGFFLICCWKMLEMMAPLHVRKGFQCGEYMGIVVMDVVFLQGSQWHGLQLV